MAVLGTLSLLCGACFAPAGGDEHPAESSSSSDGERGSSEESDDSSGSSGSETSNGTTDAAEEETSTGLEPETDESGESSGGDDSTGGEMVACDVTQPFAEIRLIEELATPDDEGSQSLAPDELTIYYFSNTQSPGTADLDVYVATRDAIDEPFGPSAPLDQINSGSDDRGGWITPDELSFYFYSSRSGSYDLFVSSRGNIAAAFGAPELLGPDLNTEAIEQSPYVTPDGSMLYFQRDSFLYRAELGADGFEQPTPVGELNDGGVAAPLLTEDGLTIYFSSSRPGGAGNLDIWRATRDEPDGVFDEPMNVSELNLDDFEFPEWISSDGCRLYLTSRRPGGAGGWDMWIAERPQ